MPWVRGCCWLLTCRLVVVRRCCTELGACRSWQAMVLPLEALGGQVGGCCLLLLAGLSAAGSLLEAESTRFRSVQLHGRPAQLPES